MKPHASTSGVLRCMLLATCVLWPVACGDGGRVVVNPVGPSSGAASGATGLEVTPPSPGPGEHPTPAPSPTPQPPAAERLQEVLTLAIQDEYRAAYTYGRVLLDLGDRTPFSHVVEAEWQHVEVLSRLFSARGLAVPGSLNTLDDVPRFESFRDACQAGVAAETALWRMYSAFLTELRDAAALPHDVGNVFTNLGEASRDRHLPAFVSCAG